MAQSRPVFVENRRSASAPQGRRRYFWAFKYASPVPAEALTASMAPLAFLHPRLGLSRTTSRSNWRSTQKPSERDRPSIPGGENLDFSQGRTCPLPPSKGLVD